MPIHDIDVKHFDASFFNAPDVFTQPDEVRRENGGDDLNHATTLICNT